MSNIDLRHPETIIVIPEAQEVAVALLGKFEASLSIDLELTGKNATDASTAALRESDRIIQQELEGTEHVYFGHTNAIDNLLYAALIMGYNPTQEQKDATNHDFMWDEVLDLSSEHPDINDLITTYGYDSAITPVSPGFVGAQVMPRKVVHNILATLYMRGKEYKAWGWGYPNWSQGSDMSATELEPVDEISVETSAPEALPNYAHLLLPEAKWVDDTRAMWSEATDRYYLTMYGADKRIGETYDPKSSTYDFTEDSEGILYELLRQAARIRYGAFECDQDDEKLAIVKDQILDDFFKDADEYFIGSGGAEEMLKNGIHLVVQLQRYAEVMQ